MDSRFKFLHCNVALLETQGHGRIRSQTAGIVCGKHETKDLVKYGS